MMHKQMVVLSIGSRSLVLILEYRSKNYDSDIHVFPGCGLVRQREDERSRTGRV